MPVQPCRENNKPGFKFGPSGKCYTYSLGNEMSKNRAKQKAHIQGSTFEKSQSDKEATKQFIVDIQP